MAKSNSPITLILLSRPLMLCMAYICKRVMQKWNTKSEGLIERVRNGDIFLDLSYVSELEMYLNIYVCEPHFYSTFTDSLRLPLPPPGWLNVHQILTKSHRSAAPYQSLYSPALSRAWEPWHGAVSCIFIALISKLPHPQPAQKSSRTTLGLSAKACVGKNVCAYLASQ